MHNNSERTVTIPLSLEEYSALEKLAEERGQILHDCLHDLIVQALSEESHHSPQRQNLIAHLFEEADLKFGDALRRLANE